MNRCASVVSMFLFVTLAHSQDATIRDEGKRLLGVWKCVSYEVSGTPFNAKETAELRVIIEPGKITYRWTKEKEVPFTYKVSPEKNPKEIDKTVLIGFGKGRVCKGIYKIEGDTLTICENNGNRERPIAFRSGFNSEVSLMVLKLVKP